MQDADTLVLEIFRQAETLKMSVFEQEELASTLRHYSQCAVAFGEIEELCREAVGALNQADKSGVLNPQALKSLQKAGQLLWDHLLTRPVKEKLKTTPASGLILSLDEELINIPWELLYDGSSFLCLNFNLGRVVRTKEQLKPPQYRSFSSIPKMLILANPTNDLKSAYLEGLFIRNQFDRKRKEVAIDFKSTSIDTLYVKKNLRDYDIVHFAGHCEYDADTPQNSGWVLGDGKFTAEDILSMGATVSLPALVFSNACHSARAQDTLVAADYQEKSYSLASAFLFSGVRHYLGAIRRIEDPVSLVFAKEFYVHLISGKPVGECVRLSRLRLIKEYGISAVGWMSYLLYGDPNFTLFKAKTKPVTPKIKRDFALLKKGITWFALGIAVISLCIYLYIWLPTLNPNTYILFNKSRQLFTAGKNQEVILTASRIIQKEPLFLAAYPLIGDTYQRLGDRESALKYYFDYAFYSDRKQDKNNLAYAYIGIGWIYYLQGNYPRAFEFYQKAQVLAKENNDKLNEADVMGKLALWYIDNKDYTKAFELLTKSAEINRQRQHIYKHRYNLACDYFNLGFLFTEQKDFAAAEEFYDKSFRLFSKLKLTYELSDYYFNIGEIQLFEKQYQKALDYYFKGLKIDRAHDNKPSIASDYNMLGELYMEMGGLVEAEKYFNQAVSLCKEIDAPPELAAAYYNLGLLYKKKGRKNLAKEYLRQAQEIYWRINTAQYQQVKEELLSLD